MRDPLCPGCRRRLDQVVPVRIRVGRDSLRDAAPIGWTTGFACPACDILLPVVAAAPDRETQADPRETEAALRVR